MTIDYVTFSNLIIDDIVFPDGRSAMNTLGGAGMHTLVGMRLWNGHLGYAATIGQDLDPIHLQTLQRFGVDCQGLVVRDGYKNARAWQIFEPDGRRIEVFRTELPDFLNNMIQETDLPAAYRQAKGIHIIWGSLVELADLIHSLRRTNPDIVLAVELTPQQEQEPAENLKLILPHISLFSPNIDEATAVTNLTDPAKIANLFLSWGAPLVAIRMGAEGSLVKTKEGEQWQLTAVPPTNLSDVTGAGNSYLGGFLTGLGDGLSAYEASLRAAVSASFALEQVGLPRWRTPPTNEVAQRLAWARENSLHFHYP